MPNNRRPKTVAEIDALYSGEARGTSPQSVGTVGLGGYTVQDELMRAIDVALLAWGNVRAAATVITTATGGPLPIPTVNDTASVGAVLAENTQVTVGDITFAQLVLNAFKYSSKSVLVSIELMQDSTVNLPAFIGERLGERIARITNQHYGQEPPPPAHCCSAHAPDAWTPPIAMKHLQRDLDALKKEILTMGSLVDEATNKAISSLTQRSPELAEEVLSGDDAIDRHELEVEEACPKALALHSRLPVTCVSSWP